MFLPAVSSSSQHLAAGPGRSRMAGKQTSRVLGEEPLGHSPTSKPGRCVLVVRKRLPVMDENAHTYQEACTVSSPGMSAKRRGSNPNNSTGTSQVLSLTTGMPRQGGSEGSTFASESDDNVTVTATESVSPTGTSPTGIPGGGVPEVGKRSPGQYGVYAMMKTISVLSLVLKFCLLCVVIYLGVAVLGVKQSVDRLDVKLERTTDKLTNVSGWLQNAIGKLAKPPGTLQDGGQISQRLEQLEGDVKTLNAKSQNMCAVPDAQSICPSGYQKYREVCYKPFNTFKTFRESANTCEADGGTLAMPRDADINAFLISLMNAVDKKGVFWFGLCDHEKEGTWEWIDGTALGTGYSAWGEGQPNNRGVAEDCAHYLRDSRRWNDDGCHHRWFFICQTMP
ncbi:hypothetical protein Bbelb_304370 [Branchiostoma belcheri]|nr:hypothetical protein Bbelb_304370 [Branchiostoma belcheri]